MKMKKVISVILSVTLVLMIVPITAFAATTVTVSTFDALKTALNTSTITEVVISNTIAIPSDTILDGKSKTVTVPVTGTDCSGVVNSDASNFNVFNMGNNSAIVNLTIKGGANSAIRITSGITCSLTNVTITQSGSSTHTGGAISNKGYLTMRNCNLFRNVAEYAGAILNSSNAIIALDKCTLSENRNIGGTIDGGGAVENSGSMYMNNCTLSNNQSTEIGGAINNNAGFLYIMNSTITGNVSYYSGNTARFGGGIGFHGGKLRMANSVITNNYVTTNGKSYTNSDIGEYLDFNTDISIYNSIVGGYYNSSNIQSTPATNVDNVINDNSVNSGLFRAYRDANILNADGTVYSGSTTFSRPVIVKQTNGLYTVPLDLNTTTDTTAVNCYCNFDDITAVKIGFGTDDSITALTDTAPASTYKVTEFEDGTSRITNVKGAVPKTDATFYTVKLAINGGGAVDGLSIYGETVAAGTTLTLKATPSKSYLKWQTSTDGLTFNDVTSEKTSVYKLTVNSDLFVKSITKTPYNNPIDASGANINVYEETDRDIAVWGKIKALNIDDPDSDDVVFSVNIGWGSLTYDYDQGTWNPVTLQSEGAGWSPTESGVSDKLTITNRSNVAVDAGLAFANIGGTYLNLTTTNVFFNEAAYSTNVTNSTLNIATALGKTEDTIDKQSAYLKITGTPTVMTDTTQYVRIGTITVTIAQHDNT